MHSSQFSQFLQKEFPHPLSISTATLQGCKLAHHEGDTKIVIDSIDIWALSSFWQIQCCNFFFFWVSDLLMEWLITCPLKSYFVRFRDSNPSTLSLLRLLLTLIIRFSLVHFFPFLINFIIIYPKKKKKPYRSRQKNASKLFCF